MTSLVGGWVKKKKSKIRQFFDFFLPIKLFFLEKKFRQITLTSESEWELEADCDLRLRLFRGGGTLRLLAEVDPVGGGYN